MHVCRVEPIPRCHATIKQAIRVTYRLALLLVAFLSGAILMALEIVGSRVLAPHFGGSIYVWGSLIGVFLAALSLGYYLGGRLVDHRPSAGLLSLFLLAAGAWVLLLLRYGWVLCDAIAVRDLGERANPLLACTVLFFVPGVLMGTTSPFVIRLTARTVAEIGRTAGAVYAISTVGSIAGTLGTAFYLLSWLGTRMILLVLGASLILTAVLAAAASWRRSAGVVSAVLLTLCLAAGPSAAGERILLERDSPYHRILVTEEGGYRYLRADNVWHTQMKLSDPQGRGLPYSDYIDLAFLFNPEIKRVLVIGLGGGTIPKRFVRDYPGVKVDAVEIDADVVQIAKRHFYVEEGPRLAVHKADGRMFLRRSKEKWDLIVLDAYYADTVPFFLTTKEFFGIVRDHLSPSGVVVNNVIGSVSGPKSKFFRSVYRTMGEVFPHLQAFKVAESGAQIMNIEVFATVSGSPVTAATLSARASRMQGSVIKDDALGARLANRVTEDIGTRDVPVLTDDYAPVDALLHLW